MTPSAESDLRESIRGLRRLADDAMANQEPDSAAYFDFKAHEAEGWLEFLLAEKDAS